MKYHKEVTLKNGKTCLLRNGDRADGRQVFEVKRTTC